MKTTQASTDDQKLGAFPQLTTADLKEAKNLQRTWDRLHLQHVSLFPDGLAGRYLEALAEYSTKSTEDNLEALKRAAIEKEYFRTNKEIRRAAHRALENFVNEQVRPWAVAVIERALSEVRAAAQRLHDQEKTRHDSLTEQPFVSSALVDIASAPIAELERILQLINSHIHFSPDKLVTKFGHRPIAAPLPALLSKTVSRNDRPAYESMEVAELIRIISGRGWTVPNLDDLASKPKAQKLELISIIDGKPSPTGRREGNMQYGAARPIFVADL